MHYLPRLRTGLRWVLLLAAFAANADAPRPDLTWGRSVVKVMADTRTGRVSMGSGVVVARDRVATNCHVTRGAATIVVFKGIARYRVHAQSVNPHRDVCILHTLDLKLPPARSGRVGQSRVGDRVFVFGFPAAVGISMVRGEITGLHRYRDTKIIETDAGFMRGTSGGAIFSTSGELIGLPTFMKTSARGGQFYAVPVDWVMEAIETEAGPIGRFSESAFWEDSSWRVGVAEENSEE